MGGSFSFSLTLSLFFFFNFKIFISLAASVLVEACGIKFFDQGLNPGPLHWEHEVLATGPPGSPSAV